MKRTSILIVMALVLASLSGCATHQAVMDQITQAERGLNSAADSLTAQHQELLDARKTQMAALDAAFDADVRLAATGKIVDAQNVPITLTADWIISARKGYVAGRDIIAESIRTEQKAHDTDLDNITASREALGRAITLIVMQSNLSENTKGWVLSAQRALAKPTTQKAVTNGK